MATTARGYPYPVLADPANVPSDVQALASSVDADVTGLGTWTTYTSTWGSTGTQPVLNNGTLVAKYISNTKLVILQLALTIGSTSTMGSGAWSFSLPFTSNSHTSLSAIAKDTSATKYWAGSGWTNTGSNSLVLVILDANTAGIDVANPFTWATGDFLYITGIYERT